MENQKQLELEALAAVGEMLLFDKGFGEQWNREPT